MCHIISSDHLDEHVVMTRVVTTTTIPSVPHHLYCSDHLDEHVAHVGAAALGLVQRGEERQHERGRDDRAEQEDHGDREAVAEARHVEVVPVRHRRRHLADDLADVVARAHARARVTVARRCEGCDDPYVRPRPLS